MEIKVSNVLILCDIVDFYPIFNEDLIELLENNEKLVISNTLSKLVSGNYFIGHKDIKSFYKKHKYTIDIISKYDNIGLFINDNYNTNGIIHHNIYSFYHYIEQNRSEINSIKRLLYSLIELGFDRINYNPSLDFTKEIYSMDKKFVNNIEIVYLDNLELVPNYPSSIVTYKSNGSNYMIILEKHCFSKEIYNQAILLNSLSFDIEKLPKSITKEVIFDHIYKLIDEKEDIYNTIKSAVELSVSIDDLYKNIDNTAKVIDNIKDNDPKERLIEELNKLKQQLNTLKKIDDQYNLDISNNDSFVSESIINDEKQKFKRRRDVLNKL